MTMHKALHPGKDIDRLYVSCRVCGGGLARIEDSVNAFIWLEENIEESKDILVTMA